MREYIVYLPEKYCPCCERMLSIKHFDKNASRPDGMNVYCKECYIEKRGKRRPQKVYKRCMTTDEFIIIYSDEKLKLFIRDYACSKTRDIELTKDLIQDAWIRLSYCMPGLSDDRLKEIATKAIDSSYNKYYYKKGRELEAFEDMTSEDYLMWSIGRLE